MIKRVIQYILLVALLPVNVHARSTTENTKPLRTKLRHLEFGIGVPTIKLRENVTTSLAYTGTGVVGFHIGTTRQHANKTFKQFGIDVNALTAKPAIANLSKWNKSASIFAFNFLYRNLKGVHKNDTKKWKYFVGGSLSLNGQVAIIPSTNNTLSYNFNWLQAGLEGMIKRDFKFKKKNFQFTYQASLPIAGITVRPKSYVGLQPTPAIWEQESNDLAIMFTSPKFSSLHNNFMFRNDISLDMQLRKSNLRLNYFWQFTNNKVAVNTMNSVLSSINVTYLIKLKNK
jgi:hypothetical protein